MFRARVDVRGLYRDEGYSSLFEYCVKALHMSEGEASLRIRAARLSRRFPVVFAMVERGQLHLSALRALAPTLTVDNHRQLLAAATHKTRREVEQMLADRAPQPEVKGVMRRLPSATSSPNRSKDAGSQAEKPAEPQSLETAGAAARRPDGSSVTTTTPLLVGGPPPSITSGSCAAATTP